MGRRFKIRDYNGPIDPIPPQLETIGDLLADPKHQLHARCLPCGYHQVVDIITALRALGPGFRLEGIAATLRCSRCRGKGASVCYGYDRPLPRRWDGR